MMTVTTFLNPLWACDQGIVLPTQDSLSPDPGYNLSPDPGYNLTPNPGHSQSPDPGHS